VAGDNTKTRRLAVFDLDGTLSRRDTFGPFVLWLLRRQPQRWLRLPLLLGPLLAFTLRIYDRGQLKGAVIHLLFAGLQRQRVEVWAMDFAQHAVSELMFRDSLNALRSHIAAGDHTVLLSASPDLYVPHIARALGTSDAICTEIRWLGDRLDGRLLSRNRRGSEKTRVLETLRAQHPGLPVIAYGNSTPDLDHMRQCEEAVYVNPPTPHGPALVPPGIRSVRWR
jgi:phosphatidylglycerophosphatase C